VSRIRNPYEAIVNVASATVLSGSPLWAHYVASKGALIALSRVMARERSDASAMITGQTIVVDGGPQFL
jgi:NAD(P)-dependent dehydrogenase (short-subunit alcohol dehydrogenase family)